MPTEYTRCPLCGAWAKVIRHKDREHRDRLECDHCGVTLVSDAIPIGVSPRMKGNDMYEGSDGL